MEIKWAEFDLDKVFASGRDTFGEEEKKEKMMEEAALLTGIPGEAPTSIPNGTETKTALSAVEEAPFPKNTSDMRDLAESVKMPTVYEDQIKGGLVAA